MTRILKQYFPPDYAPQLQNMFSGERLFLTKQQMTWKIPLEREVSIMTSGILESILGRENYQHNGKLVEMKKQSDRNHQIIFEMFSTLFMLLDVGCWAKEEWNVSQWAVVLPVPLLQINDDTFIPVSFSCHIHLYIAPSNKKIFHSQEDFW